MFQQITPNVPIKGIDLPLTVASEIYSITIVENSWTISYANRHAGTGQVIINEGQVVLNNSMPQWAAVAPIMKLIEKAFKALLPGMLQRLNPAPVEVVEATTSTVPPGV